MKDKRDLQLIGTRIRDVRIRLGLSLEEFAQKVDPDGKAKSGTISNWEKARNAPNRKRLERIAELGNVSVEYIEGKSDDPAGWDIIQKRTGYSKKQIEDTIQTLIDTGKAAPKRSLKALQRDAVISLDSMTKSDLDAVKYAINGLNDLMKAEDQLFYLDPNKLASLTRLNGMVAPMKQDRYLDGSLIKDNLSNNVYLEIQQTLEDTRDRLQTIIARHALK